MHDLSSEKTVQYLLGVRKKTRSELSNSVFSLQWVTVYFLTQIMTAFLINNIKSLYGMFVTFNKLPSCPVDHWITASWLCMTVLLGLPFSTYYYCYYYVCLWDNFVESFPCFTFTWILYTELRALSLYSMYQTCWAVSLVHVLIRILFLLFSLAFFVPGVCKFKLFLGYYCFPIPLLLLGILGKSELNCTWRCGWLCIEQCIDQL